MSELTSSAVRIERGTSRRIRVPIYLDSTKRRPDDVTGWTGKLWVKRKPLDPAEAALLEVVGTVDIPLKEFWVDLTWAMTDALPVGDHVWEVRVTTASNKKYAIVEAGSPFVVFERGSDSP